MSGKAQCCDECKHWTRTIPPCALGHKPRFYMPRYVNDSCGWGWKRRRGDFNALEVADERTVV